MVQRSSGCPDGGAVAFLDHPALGDDGGRSPSWTGRQEEDPRAATFPRRRPRLVSQWKGSLVHGGGNRRQPRPLCRDVVPVRERALARVTGNLTLQDVSRTAAVLIPHDALRSGILGSAPVDEKERDLSWLDWSSVQDIAPDGKSSSSASRARGGGRATPPTAAHRRLAPGPSGRRTPEVDLAGWPMGRSRSSTGYRRGRSSLLPTGAGEPRADSGRGLARTAAWIPDGKRI